MGQRDVKEGTRKVAIQGELQLVPPTWGGRRAGAGRKRKVGQHDSPHRPRPVLLGRHPVHTVLRTLPSVGRLRKRAVFQAVRRALVTIGVGGDFRVVHMSIQHNHLHLLVEAGDQRALSRGMQRLAILVARAINRSLGRKGRVFAHRYHRTDITTPRQARHALAYVLNNWRRHREDQARTGTAARLDPYSTAAHFDGWLGAAALRAALPAAHLAAMLPSAPPRTWLLRVGWRTHGELAATEVPGPARRAGGSADVAARPSPSVAAATRFATAAPRAVRTCGAPRGAVTSRRQAIDARGTRNVRCPCVDST